MLISDNASEFNNSLFANMAEMFNINIKPTAAESPWSNGMVERHNAILAKTKKTTPLISLLLVQLMQKIVYIIVMDIAQTN